MADHSQSEVEVLLLGAVEVHRGPERFLLTARARAVLALLALHAGSAVPVDRLIDDVWGNSPPSGARNTLQQYASQLRRGLGRDAVELDQGGYRLALHHHQVDAVRFSDLASQAHEHLSAGRLDEALEHLTEAFALWRGDPMHDLADYDFARIEAGRLHEARASALEDLAEAEVRLGHHDRVVATLTPLLAEYPFRDRLRAAVMTALYHQGRQVEALEIYEQGRVLLAEELGLDPSPALRALHVGILNDELSAAAPLPSRRPALDMQSPPAPASPLVGRDDEVLDIRKLLESAPARLVTLLGPGGTGKTRLAVEAVTIHLPERFTGHVAWVDLVNVEPAGGLMRPIAAAAGITDHDVTVEGFAAAAGTEDWLLVLDNVEHLLPSLAHLTDDLLRHLSGMTVLTTSRTALGLAGEHRVLVGPLPVPESTLLGDNHASTSGQPVASTLAIAASPAVRLFLERAEQVSPGFRLDEDNALDVAELCRRLDGLPLAVELAAARMGVLEPGDLLRQGERGLTLLEGPRHDLDRRHESLRATLQWSHRLLSAGAANLFRMLAAFRGGFSLEAATEVAALAAASDPDGAAGPVTSVAVVEALQELVDASLVLRRAGEARNAPVRRAAPRFSMLVTVHTFASELLAGDEAEDRVREAHTRHYAAAASDRWRSLPMWPRTASELLWFREEDANLRAAAEWARAHANMETLADVVLGSSGYWDHAGQWALAGPWVSAIADLVNLDGDTSDGEQERDGAPMAGASPQPPADPSWQVRRADAAYFLSIRAQTDSSRKIRALRHAERAVSLLPPGADPYRAAVFDAMAFGLRVVAEDFARAHDGTGDAGHGAGEVFDEGARRVVTLQSTAAELSDRDQRAYLLYLAAQLAQVSRQPGTEQLLMAARDAAQAAGNDDLRIEALISLAGRALGAQHLSTERMIPADQQDPQAALRWCAEAHQLPYLALSTRQRAWVQVAHAQSLVAVGDLERVRAALPAAVRVALSHHDDPLVSSVCATAAHFAAATGRYKEAAIALGVRAQRFAREDGGGDPPTTHALASPDLADTLIDRLGSSTAQARHQEGANLTLSEVVTLVDAISGAA